MPKNIHPTSYLIRSYKPTSLGVQELSESILVLMWTDLPFDLLLHIFSYLSPESLARANATCRNWHATAETAAILVARLRLHPPWFVTLPMGSWGLSCYAHNPIEHNWIELSLHHPTTSIKPIATISGLIIFKFTNTTSLNLARCNPFTNQFRALPTLNVARTNPAVGAVENSSNLNMGFKIYVAGGMSEGVGCAAATYQATIEMYDSFSDKWEVIGAMPVEFAVRLTVWSPNESVYSNGTLYWMTSARAYSVMGFDIWSNRWRELSVPMADRLEFAALVPRNGKLAVVGGECGGDARVWELGEDDLWKLVGKVPLELGIRLLGEKMNWGSVKCVGIEGVVCLYKDLGSGVIIWRAVDDERGWGWIEGCYAINGRGVRNFPIKGLLLQPNLAHSTF